MNSASYQAVGASPVQSGAQRAAFNQRNANFKFGSEQFTEYATSSRLTYAPQTQMQQRRSSPGRSSPAGDLRRSHFELGNTRDTRSFQSVSQMAFRKDSGEVTLMTGHKGGVIDKASGLLPLR